MDKEIFDRYKNSQKPFGEKVLYTNTVIPVNNLRKIVEATLKFLRQELLLDGKVYKVWDWFEHDGYLDSKQIVTEEFLNEFTKDNELFYNNRSGDTYVKMGLYDEFSRWYIRIYIIDEYDLKEGEQNGGTFDISSNENMLNSLSQYLFNNIDEELQMETAKEYFEKRYAG